MKSSCVEPHIQVQLYNSFLLILSDWPHVCLHIQHAGEHLKEGGTVCMAALAICYINRIIATGLDPNYFTRIYFSLKSV